MVSEGEGDIAQTRFKWIDSFSEDLQNVTSSGTPLFMPSKTFNAPSTYITLEQYVNDQTFPEKNLQTFGNYENDIWKQDTKHIY